MTPRSYYHCKAEQQPDPRTCCHCKTGKQPGPRTCCHCKTGSSPAPAAKPPVWWVMLPIAGGIALAGGFMIFKKRSAADKQRLTAKTE